MRPASQIATYLDTVPGNSLSKPPGRGEAGIILPAILLLFSSCIRNTVAIKVPEGVSELFEISKI